MKEEVKANSYQMAPMSEVIADYRAGKMVIIVDDDNRENEGDVAVATEKVTPETLAFMMNEGRGLICVSVSRDVAERVKLFPQVNQNNSRYGTAFTATIDHKSVASNGISAAARAETMRRLIDPNVSETDFVTPGNVFPLIANPRGVLGRRGQTEGSYDLARISGLNPSGIICEILNPDGTMARGDSLIAFAQKHNLKITSVDAIAKHILENEIFVRLSRQEDRLTDYGQFSVSYFESNSDGKEHMALVYGDLTNSTNPPLVRIHSECLTGDVLGSRRCDCGTQLSQAMQSIVTNGSGVLLYLRQEGRGIELSNKLKAYELQDKGLDTVEANIKLGFKADERDFAVAAKMLNLLGIQNLKLLTNNPNKLSTIQKFGFNVIERVGLICTVNDHNRRYLEAKKEKLGHFLNVGCQSDADVSNLRN